MNHQALSSIIWSVADLLRGDYKQSEYGRVILPFTLLRRLDCLLKPTKSAVLAEFEAKTKAGVNPEPFLIQEAGLSFYNTSHLDLVTLLDDEDSIRQNLYAYVQAFSPAVRHIFESFDFSTQVERLARANLLYLVVDKFAKMDLDSRVLEDAQMGRVFEELIRKFAEVSNETAGEHFTPRDVVGLMVRLLFLDEEGMLTRGNAAARTIYDPTAGTGGMLSTAGEYLSQHNSSVSLTMFGQELNQESYAICKADMLVKGQYVDNIVLGNTLSNDGHSDRKFDYILSNPPFGVEWRQIEKAIRQEHEQGGSDGRFGPALPRVSDASFLFVMHMISKMKRAAEGGSRVGMVVSGAVLFTGDIGAGENRIRKWILEQDLLEGIVALPEGLFMNTGIASYLIFLSTKKKLPRREIIFIDATKEWEILQRHSGSKVRYLSEKNIEFVCDSYKGKVEGAHVFFGRQQDMLYKNYRMISHGATISHSVPLSVDADARFAALSQKGVAVQVQESEQVGCRFDFWSFALNESEARENAVPLSTLVTQCSENEIWDFSINRSTGDADFSKGSRNSKAHRFYRIERNLISPQFLRHQLEYKRTASDIHKSRRGAGWNSDTLAQWVECPPANSQNAVVEFYASKEQLLRNIDRLELLQWQQNLGTNMLRRSIKEYRTTTSYLVETLPHPLAALLHKIICETNKREIIEGYRAFYECLGALLLSIALGVILEELGLAACRETLKHGRSVPKKITMGAYPKTLVKAMERSTEMSRPMLKSIITQVAGHPVIDELEKATKIRNEVAHHGLLTSSQSSDYIDKYEKILENLAENLDGIFSEAELVKPINQKWNGQVYENDMLSLTGVASTPFQRVTAMSSKPLISNDLYYRLKDLNGDVFVRLFHFVRCVEIVEGGESEGIYFFNSVDDNSNLLNYASFQPLIESRKQVSSEMIKEVFAL
ncbi:class I SAM-dependent DNA methyltransferase [Paraburkholderia sp. BCC1876]|uniref:type I restriction-modification system subunit M n=1 Tax=Paraburkholderia sp. BCC1876 TaxID=2676303 RepID=UPI00159125FA|nr:class I SAM-dependent DNA methyltransferase [Paraburkholderia sp. BCC1876]